MMSLTSELTTAPRAAADDHADGQRQRVRLRQERLELTEHWGAPPFARPARDAGTDPTIRRAQHRPAREHLEQPVDERRLRRVEPAARLRGTRPRPPGRSRGRAALARSRAATRSPRPCSELGRIHVALDRPGVDDLARSHPDLAEVDRLAGRGLLAGLLLELASGRSSRSSVSSGAPLGSDQAPVSRRDQIGPPGWATSTSTPSPARR